MFGQDYLFSDPEFKIGDKVIFELSSEDYKSPRWLLNDDMGGSGSSIEGVVTYVDDKHIRVDHTVENVVKHIKISTIWPNKKHPDYDDLQWWQDGYLQFVARGFDCECGAEKIYGLFTSHSSWCPKH